jgi:DNA helicase-2/ATP-dependent DNA helicase PcrA
MEFQQEFGDRLPDAHTASMIKLEENYRSVANILELANQLIDNNTQRIDKVLKATRPDGDLIELYRAEDEVDEVGMTKFSEAEKRLREELAAFKLNK